MKQGWRKLATQTLLKHPRLKVVEDRVELPDGYTTKYLRFEELTDYVIVVATQGNRIALLKEYAYPLDEWIWQLPAGGIGPGETALEAGVRELSEETGHDAADIIELGAIIPEHRRSAHRGHVLYAHGVKQGVKAPGDPEEQGTELHWVSIERIQEMIRSGEVNQGSTLAALTLYFVNFATKPTP